MQPSGLSVWLYRCARYGSIGYVVIVVAIGAFVHVYEFEAARFPVISSIQCSLKSILTGLTIAAGFVLASAEWICNWIGKPSFWKRLGHILTDLQQEIFGVVEGAVEDHHRVTLYKRRQWCLPWFGICGARLFSPWGKTPSGRFNGPRAGWMCPIVRSGMLSNGKTKFLARTDEDSWGVAGTAFFQQNRLFEVENLPALKRESKDADFADYSKRAYAPKHWIVSRVRSGHPCARSFRALVMEVDKKKWGVLMIDSNEAAFPSPDANEPRFDTVALVLKSLLEKA